MALLRILLEGDSTLRKKSRRVDRITPRIITLVNDMKETMAEANGVGLAAPQVGVLRRIVIVDTGDNVIEMINPEVIKTEGVIEDAEACLSLPGKYGLVRRPAVATVRYTDINGNEMTVTGEDIVARAFCHEIDHLDGILYPDRAIRMLDPEEVHKE